jgi:Na+/proline symporter
VVPSNIPAKLQSYLKIIHVILQVVYLAFLLSGIASQQNQFPSFCQKKSENEKRNGASIFPE